MAKSVSFQMEQKGHSIFAISGGRRSSTSKGTVTAATTTTTTKLTTGRKGVPGQKLFTRFSGCGVGKGLINDSQIE